LFAIVMSLKQRSAKRNDTNSENRSVGVGAKKN